MMISRDEAIQLLHTYAKDDHELLWKSYAVEHILRLLSYQFDEEEEVWGLTGLLYDLDYEYTSRNPENHTLITSNLLMGLLPEEAIDAIKSHNYVHTGSIPTSFLSKALLASDAAVGLILNLSKETPLKKITKKVLLAAYKNSSYDIYYQKEWLLLCSDLSLKITDFLYFCLKSLKEINGTLQHF
jgi:uncharacterized protein